jgi:hypothetical protein
MIVEDQLDGGVGRAGVVEPLEVVEPVQKADKFARSTAILDAGVRRAGEPVDPGEPGSSAAALEFVIACQGHMRPGLGGKSGAVLPIAWIPGGYQAFRRRK